MSNTLQARVWFFGVAAMLVVALGTAPAWAQAQPQGDKELAKELYTQGKTQFDLGNFEDAVKLFKDAYKAAPYPAFLFNIAQAYRQMGDCRQALFFYKRYLTVAGDKVEEKERVMVEGYIGELSKTCKATEEMKNKPPLGAKDPGEEGGEQGGGEVEGDEGDNTQVAAASGSEDTGGEVEGGGKVVKPVMLRKQPRLFTGAVEVGPAFLQMGDLAVGGAQFSLLVSGGYPLNFGKAGVSLGGLVTYTPIPWSNGDLKGQAALTSLVAHVAGRYRVMDRLALRADVGLGALILSGLTEGDVFLPPNRMTTGALGMFHVRVGVGVEYSFTDNIAVSVTPFAFSTSKPPVNADTGEGLREGIDSMSRIEATLGLNYSL